jgi:hypothetical protein
MASKKIESRGLPFVGITHEWFENSEEVEEGTGTELDRG